MFEPIAACRSCGSSDLMMVIDLGMQYLSDFRADNSKPPMAPLTLMMCEKCNLVQLAHTVDRTDLYHDNYGFRSSVNESIVKDLRSIAYSAMAYVRAGKWLDIASNDGTLLSFVPNNRFYKVGVDPVTKFYDEAVRYADEIHPAFFSAEVVDHQKFDVITSISMFYDIHELDRFVAEVSSVMSDHGVWIIQQNYLPEMLRLGAVDNICHEHLTYFDLNTLHALLWRHGLIITDAQVSPVNGGVLRTVVRKFDTHQHVNRSVERLFKKERTAGIGEVETMSFFVGQVKHNLDKLLRVVDESKNQPIDIYGASTRGAVLWQAADIDYTRVSFAVERQEEKVGKWFSPLGIQIISEEEMRANPPQSLLVGPWWHREGFIEREEMFLKNGGKMIFPLPNVEVIGG